MNEDTIFNRRQKWVMKLFSLRRWIWKPNSKSQKTTKFSLLSWKRKKTSWNQSQYLLFYAQLKFNQSFDYQNCRPGILCRWILYVSFIPKKKRVWIVPTRGATVWGFHSTVTISEIIRILWYTVLHNYHY